MNGDEYKKILKRNCKEAHKLFFDEYYNYVGTIVLNHLRNVGSIEDIEECISDVFAKTFFVLEDQPVTGDLKKFIATIAKRTSIDCFRTLSKRTERSVSLDEEKFSVISSDDDLEAENERGELQRIVAECICSLGEPDSTIVIQKFYYNKTSRQIAELLSMKPSAVRMRVKRSGEQLRAALAERGIKEELL
ncbi:MAG: sigma-70 family RNA polymerase sigma factor [Oscillospiraceae bacterium]|nr:sigma-70 family RNA polymerase sigma factor [Oscillospiraceae bacterium]